MDDVTNVTKDPKCTLVEAKSQVYLETERSETRGTNLSKIPLQQNDELKQISDENGSFVEEILESDLNAEQSIGWRPLHLQVDKPLLQTDRCHSTDVADESRVSIIPFSVPSSSSNSKVIETSTPLKEAVTCIVSNENGNTLSSHSNDIQLSILVTIDHQDLSSNQKGQTNDTDCDAHVNSNGVVKPTIRGDGYPINGNTDQQEHIIFQNDEKKSESFPAISVKRFSRDYLFDYDYNCTSDVCPTSTSIENSGLIDSNSITNQGTISDVTGPGIYSTVLNLSDTGLISKQVENTGAPLGVGFIYGISESESVFKNDQVYQSDCQKSKVKEINVGNVEQNNAPEIQKITSGVDHLTTDQIEKFDESNGRFKNGVYIANMPNLSQALKRGNGSVKTRFPPEPSGPLHLGHVRALHINFATARYYRGKCGLRFDDSNPVTAKENCYSAIRESLEWLGYKPATVTKTSEHFSDLYQFALQLIKDGCAYVCHQETRVHLDPKERSLAEDSPYRFRLVEENQKEFQKMFRGCYNNGEAVLRLKYKSPSGFKDPVAYRVNKHPHCITGTSWCIYPTYDFCHPICDHLEGIGFSLCSEEFYTHRDLYEWLLTRLNLSVPEQREFPRLKLPFNITSKRAVAQMREVIIGDDDPRLLTVAGMRRRGLPAAVINDFVSSSSDALQLGHLEDVARQHFDPICVRKFVVIDPLKCYVNNFEKFKLSRLEASEASRDDRGGIVITVPDHPLRPGGPYSNQTLRQVFYINRFDFVNTVDKCPQYLTRNSSVLLRHALAQMAVENVQVKNGKVELLEVNLKYIPGRLKKTKVLTWLSDIHSATLNVFDNILDSAEPERDQPLVDQINPLSWCKCPIYLEKKTLNSLKTENQFTFGQTFQAERLGYVTVDPSSTLVDLQLNLTCFLKLHPEMLQHVLDATSVVHFKRSDHESVRKQ